MREARFRWRRVACAAVSAVVALGVAGCSRGPGGETTCSAFAAMAPDTGLMSNLSDQQTQVIQKMLGDHDKSTDATNMMLAQTQIIAYCNIYGGRAGSNADQPIQNIAGLQ